MNIKYNLEYVAVPRTINFISCKISKFKCSRQTRKGGIHIARQGIIQNNGRTRMRSQKNIGEVPNDLFERMKAINEDDIVNCVYRLRHKKIIAGDRNAANGFTLYFTRIKFKRGIHAGALGNVYVPERLTGGNAYFKIAARIQSRS